METTYRVKGKDSGLEFIFKYDLNGVLIMFEKNQSLTEKQRLWLYSGIFPETEKLMEGWIKEPVLRRRFVVEKLPADLSFDNLWNLYGYKVSKEDAIKAFKKLKGVEVLNAFLGIKQYEDHLAHKKVGKAHLSRYLNGKYFNNEY